MVELRPFFITERLLLRPWEPYDMHDLYKHASNPNVCVAAGYPVHTSPQHSLEIIDRILSRPGTYAIVPRDVRRPVGSIGLNFGKDGNMCLGEGEAEIGYWIGEEYWGRGLVPEAVKELLRYCFEELRLDRVWCICRTDNAKSMRVQEKCGFSYVRDGTIDDPIYGVLEMRFTYITMEDWTSGRTE